jgi:hypothetical protein
MIWAHHTANGRVALRTRSCPQCLPEALTAFGVALPEDGEYVQLPTSCGLCSEPLSPTELDVTYLTWYEGDGKHSAMFAVCNKDSLERWYDLGGVGEQLVDRERWNGSRTR